MSIDTHHFEVVPADQTQTRLNELVGLGWEVKSILPADPCPGQYGFPVSAYAIHAELRTQPETAEAVILKAVHLLNEEDQDLKTRAEEALAVLEDYFS